MVVCSFLVQLVGLVVTKRSKKRFYCLPKWFFR